MKSHPSLNRPSPAEKSLSSTATAPNLPVIASITEKKLMVACSSRKMIRNAPLMLWMNFFPIDELKMNIVYCFFTLEVV
ncbi:MAG: hypothetical protein HUJ83_04175 [Veillonella sp.]|nr:hypothetical protein [Veillonella sp.]